MDADPTRPAKIPLGGESGDGWRECQKEIEKERERARKGETQRESAKERERQSERARGRVRETKSETVRQDIHKTESETMVSERLLTRGRCREKRLGEYFSKESAKSLEEDD